MKVRNLCYNPQMVQHVPDATEEEFRAFADFLNREFRKQIDNKTIARDGLFEGLLRNNGNSEKGVAASMMRISFSFLEILNAAGYKPHSDDANADLSSYQAWHFLTGSTVNYDYAPKPDLPEPYSVVTLMRRIKSGVPENELFDHIIKAPVPVPPKSAQGAKAKPSPKSS